MINRLIENAKIVPALNPAAPYSAGTTNGIVVLRLNYNSLIVGLAVGAATGTPTSFSVTVKIQTGNESNGSDMADLIDPETGEAYTTGALIANNTNVYKPLLIDGAKKYIRVVQTVTFVGGTAPTIPSACAFTLGDETYSENIYV